VFLFNRKTLGKAAFVIHCVVVQFLAGAKESLAQITFEPLGSEVTSAFRHFDGFTGQYRLVEAMTGGVAVLDYDGDGDEDIYLLSGQDLDGEPDSRKTNALLRNDGSNVFVNVTQTAGVGDTGFSLGVAVGDYNNDGCPDIFVNNYGRNNLYQNNGDGTFTSVAHELTSDLDAAMAAGCCFLDRDGDGDLDLFVANYVRESFPHKTHVYKGKPTYPSPLRHKAERDLLFDNLGDGHFREIGRQIGVGTRASRSMGVTTFDYEDDGDLDILVANDAEENFLYANDGSGNFEEVGLLAGIALDARGLPQASMGIACLDLNGDHRLDLYMSSYSNEFAAFYENKGDGFFDDETVRSGGVAFRNITWGIVAADFDNDGAVDLYIGCGDLDDDQRADVEGNLVLWNNHRGGFKELPQPAGGSTRGVVGADLNSDGLVDVVCNNSSDLPEILINTSKSVGGYLDVRLVGTACNRDALGSRVTLQADGYRAIQQLTSGTSYQSDGSRLLHFGVPDAAGGDLQLTVHWPDGSTQSEISVTRNRCLQVIQRARPSDARK